MQNREKHLLEYELLDVCKNASLDSEARMASIATVINKMKAKKLHSPLCSLDINIMDQKKLTPLMYLASNGNAQMLKMLLENGANAELENDVGNTALEIAIDAKNVECANILISKCIDINHQDGQKITPLMHAAYNGLQSCVEDMVKKNAHINLSGNNGATALMYAGIAGQTDCLQTLISAKADVDYLDDQNQSALMKAIVAKQNDSAILLMNAKANLELSDNSGMTALTFAILNNNLTMAAQLSKQHVKITHPVLFKMMLSQHGKINADVQACFDALNKQYPDIHQEVKTATASASHDMAIIPFLLDTNTQYAKLTANEKIDLCALRIEEACQLLQKQMPHATWIFAWREYGIHDPGSRSISDESRKKLKTTMKALSKKYPNAIIIAGTVLTRKEKKLEELSQILSYYDNLKWLESIEKEQAESEKHQQLLFHKKQIQTIIKDNQDLQKKVTVVSNKARIYCGGREMRHGKIAPYYETKGLGNAAVYQPGKGNNINTTMKIRDNLSIAVSICREIQQGFGIFKNTFQQTPILHFVLSHSSPLPLESICATNAVLHIDSRFDPLFIKPREYKASSITTHVYPVDVCKKIVKLNTIVKSVYPVQFEILDILDKKLQMDLTIMEKIMLKHIQIETMKMLPYFYINEEEYKNYVEYIQRSKWIVDAGCVSEIMGILKKGAVQYTFTNKYDNHFLAENSVSKEKTEAAKVCQLSRG